MRILLQRKTEVGRRWPELVRHTTWGSKQQKKLPGLQYFQAKTCFRTRTNDHTTIAGGGEVTAGEEEGSAGGGVVTAGEEEGSAGGGVVTAGEEEDSAGGGVVTAEEEEGSAGEGEGDLVFLMHL